MQVQVLNQPWDGLGHRVGDRIVDLLEQESPGFDIFRVCVAYVKASGMLRQRLLFSTTPRPHFTPRFISLKLRANRLSQLSVRVISRQADCTSTMKLTWNWNST